MSSFSSISTALTALQAHRRALDVTGHNIANVNTPGYTRQRVDLQPRESPGAGSVMSGSQAAGAGVMIVGTTRLGDEFLTARVRSQTASNAELQARAETLTEIERLLSEPGEQGLSKKLSEMWSAWSTVSNTADPDAIAARTVLLNKTQAVIDAVKSGQREVTVLWNDQHAQASAHVTEVNTLSGQIAELNRAVLGTAPDGSANELVDQRDQLVTRMVELTGATVVPADRGQVNVYISGSPAVSGIDSYAVRLAGASSMATVGSDPARLVWSDATRGDVGRAGGQMAGELAALNTVLPAAGAKYDQLALSMATSINAAYAAAGATPATFLTATSAVDLRLTTTDPAQVATGAPGAGPKDGSVAAAVALLRNAPGGPDELWRAHVVGTGVQVQAASARADVAATALGTAVSDQQSSVGVSLDEETANLLVTQRAYEGAARVLTAVDQALDTLINRTGLVGEVVMTRVTHRSIQESTLANLQRNLSAMNSLQEQLSTQKRINRASDDPVGTVNVLQLRADLRATEQHGRNADDGLAWLTETETALSTTSSQLRLVKDRTLQALNTGAQSNESLAAIALEVEGIRDTVVSLANKQYLGRSVFAGTAAGPAVTRSTTGEYAWASTGSGTVERQITADSKVRVDTPGTAVFGLDDPLTNQGSVFTLLDRISEQIRTRDPGLSDSLAQLETRYATVTGALADIGARYSRVADAQQGAEDRKLTLATSLSEVESIDLPATIVQLQSQEVAYKAALGATAKVLQPSLMDFLR